MSYHEHVFERNSHKITRNADSSTHVGQLGTWVHRCLQPPFSTVSFPRHLSTGLFCPLLCSASFSWLAPILRLWLPSSSSGLVGNLARKPFVWVSHQNRQRNLLTGTYPHPHNECPTSCHTTSSSSCVNCPCFISGWLLIIFVIGLSDILGGFPSKFLKCSFYMCIRSSWLAAFSLSLNVLFLLLTSFTVFMLFEIVYLLPSLSSYFSGFECIPFVLLGLH